MRPAGWKGGRWEEGGRTGARTVDKGAQRGPGRARWERWEGGRRLGAGSRRGGSWRRLQRLSGVSCVECLPMLERSAKGPWPKGKYPAGGRPEAPTSAPPAEERQRALGSPAGPPCEANP